MPFVITQQREGFAATVSKEMACLGTLL